MESSTNNVNNKLNSKMKNTLGTFQEIIEKQSDLKKDLNSGVKQVSELAKFVKTNWKIAVPVLLGAGAFIIRGKTKTKKSLKGKTHARH